MSGTILPMRLIGADDDYIEPFRGYTYPRIHDFLVKYTPAFGTGTVHETQFVGVIEADEDVIEAELDAAGLVRNPLAAYKKASDGREGEGSWVLLPERDPDDYVTDDHRQLHLTLMPRRDDGPGREVYAHDEVDWRDDPLGHLRARNFNPADGVANTRDLIALETYFHLKDL